MQVTKGNETYSIFTNEEHVRNVVEQLKRDDPDWSYNTVESKGTMGGKTWTIMVYDENDKFLGFL